MGHDEDKVLVNNPLEEEELLSKTFYKPVENIESVRKRSKSKAGKRKKAEKPKHYKICCISLYNNDIENLDNIVAELKKRGHTKASKSQVIRYALSQIDIDNFPKNI